MANHGTASITQFAEFVGIVIRALPKALEKCGVKNNKFDIKELLELASVNGELLSDTLCDALDSFMMYFEEDAEKALDQAYRARERVFKKHVRTAPAIPADGVEFQLTLDAIHPMAMVRSDGYNPENWKFTGSVVAPQTRTFKLVRVGYCANLDEVCAKLAEHGSIPEGQWREAFKKAFPQNDGQGPIGFADPSWVLPDGNAYFPVLHEDGADWYSPFCWAGRDRVESWRWLVASK